MSNDRLVSLPVHKNPVPGRESHAPYNFVPLPEIVVRAAETPEQLPGHDTYANPGYPHTGYFDVILTTKSPLYVRCALTRQQFDLDEQGKDRNGQSIGQNTRYADRIKNTPSFFYTESPEQPVIPGSSLRGMLLSLLEIVGYGKQRRVTDKHPIYRAVGDRTALGAWYRRQTLGENQTRLPNLHFDYPITRTHGGELKGGYLCRHQGQWAIRPAREHLGESFVHVEYAQAQPIIHGPPGRQRVHSVLVSPGPRIPSNRGRRGPGTLTLNLAVTSTVASPNAGAATASVVPATLVESGHMGGAHEKHMHCAIYEPDGMAVPITIPHDMWEAYVEDREMTRGIRTRKLTSEGDPLFYLLDAQNRLVFFGPTMMFRLPYKRSTKDLIPEALRPPLAVDYADALFGYVRETPDFPQGNVPRQGGKARAYASRVSVTDAVLSKPLAPADLWLLGDSGAVLSPRILSSPKVTSFQHYLVQPDFQRQDLSFFDSPTEDADGNPRGHPTVIRGHKLYWHRGNPSIVDIQDGPHQPASTQHTRLKPVRVGVLFKFRVYFENVSDVELGALCWVLQPLGEEQREYCHSLGMGKSLGLGALKLEPTLHLTDRAARYSALFADDTWQTGLSASSQTPMRPATLDAWAQMFEKHILEALGRTGQGVRLADVKRVGILLKLLEWDASPSLDWLHRIRSMSPQDFRDRLVLPDPTHYDSRLKSLWEPAIERGTPAPSPGPKTAHGVATPTTRPSPVPEPRPLQPEASPNRPTLSRETVVLITDAKQGRARVRTERGDDIECTRLPSYPQLKAGSHVRAEVSRTDGRAVQAVFKSRI